MSLALTDDGFIAHTDEGQVSGQLAWFWPRASPTSAPITLNHSSTAETGQVRYCPVCDGFEAADKKIAVYGDPKDAAAKARFLRVYSSEVSLIPVRTPESDPDLQTISSCLPPPPEASPWRAGAVSVALEDGQVRIFDVLYPALGCRVHSDLATALGAKTNPVGCLVVDDKQQTTVDGLYAAGDVVSDLHQIVVAEGHAAIAATAIHNRLPFRFREHP